MAAIKYYIKKRSEDEWEEINNKFDGLKVLSVSGLNERGKAINVYNEQWINEPSQEEDFLITTSDRYGNPVIVRENVDIELTFIVGNKYTRNDIDVRTQHDAFIDYITTNDVYIKSKYPDKEVHCVCLEAYKPTTEKLQRGIGSYMLGTVKLHTLKLPQVSDLPIVGDLYIGFGNSVVSSVDDIHNLLNVQYYNVEDAAGDYSIVCPSTSYLWICTNATMGIVTSNVFEVPMNNAIIVGDYMCYRSGNDIIPHTMNFTITT